MKSRFLENLVEHQSVIGKLADSDSKIERAIELIARTLQDECKLMICGNGGSAADSQHIAAEFTGRFINDRDPLAAIALSTDTSALTCIANDYSFDEVFSRQVRGLGKKGDCLLAISTSGNSPNVIQAVTVANSLNIATIGMLGRDGGGLLNICDIAIVVESENTARIQEAHILMAHSMCEGVEQFLGLS